MRLAGEPEGRLFDRFILVSPQLPHDAPTTRPNGGGWVSVAIQESWFFKFFRDLESTRSRACR